MAAGKRFVKRAGCWRRQTIGSSHLALITPLASALSDRVGRRAHC
jgi:hypothetical protein